MLQMKYRIAIAEKNNTFDAQVSVKAVFRNLFSGGLNKAESENRSETRISDRWARAFFRRHQQTHPFVNIPVSNFSR
jgi:hypothetical protein